MADGLQGFERPREERRLEDEALGEGVEILFWIAGRDATHKYSGR